MNPPVPVINGPWPLRAFKIATALVLGTPATLVWLPYMLPLAIFVPFSLAGEALSGRVNLQDLRLAAIAGAGTLGLVGFWLWVFDHPRRSIRVQRIVGVLWLMGAATLGANLTVPNLAPIWFNATVVIAIGVTGMALAMILRPRPPLFPSGSVSDR